MAQTVQQPDVLNNLLKNILVSLFDQAQEEFEDRTGRRIKPSRLQGMKMNVAGKIINIALHQLDKLGDPQEKFTRFAALSNEHLPTVLGVVGEDAVIKRLGKIPRDVLNPDIVRMLDDAGAHEIAKLLAKTLPEGQRPVAKDKETVIEKAPEAPVVVVKAPDPVPVVVPFTAQDLREKIPESRPDPIEHRDVRERNIREPANDTVGILRTQLKILEGLRDQFNQPIADLRQAILEAESRSPVRDTRRFAERHQRPH